MPFSEKLINGVLYGIISYFSVVIITIVIIPNINIGQTQGSLGDHGFGSFLLYSINLIIITPIIEEFFFRFIPIFLIKSLTDNKFLLWSVIVLSSMIFGYLHIGEYAIISHGISGIIFSIAFLKGGYICSVVAHMTHNLFPAMIMFLILFLV